MARQPINTGTAANAGNGDNLRDAGNKLNASMVELYLAVGGDSDVLPDRLIQHRVASITSSGALASNKDYYVINSGSAVALTLSAGTAQGEHKFFSNRGAGTATITANLAGASVSFALAQNEAAQVIWDGTEWFIIGNQSVVTLA